MKEFTGHYDRNLRPIRLGNKVVFLDKPELSFEIDINTFTGKYVIDGETGQVNLEDYHSIIEIVPDPAMKKVIVSYFKPSGKWYTTEIIEIGTDMNGYDALFKEIPKHHRIKNMFMQVRDSDDGLEPDIVPHLFKPLEEWE